MAQHERGPGRSGAAVTVRPEDYDGSDLSGWEVTGTTYVDLDMTEVGNDGGVFTDCAFRGVRFNASLHSSAAYLNCTFVRCAFFDATFTGCKLVGSRFDGCTFGVTRVEGGDWSFVSLARADLRGVVVRGVRMREADLTSARLEGAELRDCDLSGAWLLGAHLSGCDLRGSDLSALDPREAEVRGALVTYAQAVTLAESMGLDVRPE